MSENLSQYVTCLCEHCGNGIEFNSSDLTEGEMRAAECPHCKMETILSVPQLTPSETKKQYHYNPGLGFALGAAALFGAFFAITLFRTFHNHAGARVGGTRLDADTVSAYFGIATIGNGFIFLLALLLIVRQIAFPKIIELGSNVLILPHGFLSLKTAHIPYSKIEKIWERPGSETFLHIKALGQEFVITRSLFADKESYVAAKDFLISRAPR